MEDDTDDAPPQRPESLLPYEAGPRRRCARSSCMRARLRRREGLPGEHHFYVSFRTDARGVSIPPRLLAQYPQEMTIVLQHQFWDLQVDEAGSGSASACRSAAFRPP